VLPAVALIHIPHHRNVEGEGKRSEEEEEEEEEEDDDDKIKLLGESSEECICI